MNAEEELKNDLEELQRLLTSASRPHVQKYLSTEVQRIQKVIDDRQRRTSVTQPTSAAGVLPTAKISTYAWDQSDQYLKLYVNVPLAAPGQENHVHLEVQPKSVDLRGDDIAGTNYYFNIKGLLHAIMPEGSHFKVKKDQILLMLKKKDSCKNWESVTETEQQEKDKKKPKLDDNDDPSAGMMNMMKQMYAEGDDEMKRTITKAWYEAQEKKKGVGDGMDSL